MKIFQIKKSDISHVSAQNIDCGYSLEPPRRGGSNEYPKYMFLRWGLRESTLYRHVFVMTYKDVDHLDQQTVPLWANSNRLYIAQT